MTREEELIKASIEYRKSREECGVKDPILLDEVEEAFYVAGEWADKTMLEKAIEWLNENKDNSFIKCEDPCLVGYLTDEFIEDFRKAMEK